MASPGEWYNSLPPCVARGAPLASSPRWASSSASSTFASCTWITPVFKRFQIWRLLTNFCFLGGFSFPFVMRVMMMCVACATARARSPELACAPPASRPRTGIPGTQTRARAVPSSGP